MGTYNTYSEEQIFFLRINAPLYSRKELTKLFNEKFNTDKSVLAIKSYCNNRGFNSSNDGKFTSESIHWQKGLLKEEFKSHYSEESFKRMTRNACISNRRKKPGDEVVKNGEVFVIVSDDISIPYVKRRVPKRRVVWEQHFGPIPKTHMVIHLDGNKLNCDIDNLYCIPKKFRALMNKNHWYTDSREHTLTAIKWCELYYALRK